MSKFKKLLEKLGLLFPSLETTVAVLIDAENIGPKIAGYALEEANKIGSVRVSRAYGDWTEINPPGYVELSTLYGVQRCQVDKRRSKRNSVDIALTSDAALLAGRGIANTFVLATGDQDYIPLVHSLKAVGCTVIGVGGGQSAIDLRSVCHKYILANSSPPLRTSLSRSTPVLG